MTYNLHDTLSQPNDRNGVNTKHAYKVQFLSHADGDKTLFILIILDE